MSRQFTRTLRLLGVTTLLCWSFLSPAFSVPLSGRSLNPILCPGTIRNVTNSKSLNSNQWDDVGLALTGLFSDNSTDSWLFAPGTTFVENTDGTARLTGTLNVFGFPYPNRSFAVDITFVGQTYTPPTGSPENRTGVPTTGWYYYHWGTAKLTGLGDLAGGVLTLTEHMKAFQIGIGANQAPEATDMSTNGASGWFEWTIVSQPTSGSQFNPYNPGYSVGDVAIICSGPPTICTPDECHPDLTPPTISCPANVITSCTNTCVNANWATPTTFDKCSAVTLTSNYGKNYCFPIGTTKVIYTATDASNNSATCSFTVTVPKCSPCPDIYNNVISKSCVNYSVVLSGPAPTGGNGSYEYMWLKSTSGCPTDMSQAIPGATGPSYTLPFTPTVSTYFVRCARQFGCTTWGPINESNCIKVNPGECSRPNPCDITIGGNTISKACVNGVPVLSGPTPTGGSGPWEYMWLSSTWNCPTDMSQAIAGATGATYTLPSCPSKTTYFVRCARQAGCTTWGPSNESNCVTVNANECKVTPPQCYDYDVSSTKDYCGGSTGSTYCMYLNNKNWGNSNFFSCESLVFEQQTNGTATLKGSIRSGWWDYIYVNVTFTGGTTTPPSGSPKLELCADSHTNTNGWVYYTGMSGSIKFNDWKTLSISRRGPAFQVGQGGDLQDKNLFGASGWFTLSDGTQGDFNFRLGNQRSCGSHWDDLQSAVSLNMNAFADYRRTNIEWTNNSGQNNDYFAVQKLSDAGNFDDLEVMSAYDPTPDVKYYQTYDNAPVDGDNFYRVKLTLRDGTVKYSEIKKVSFKNLSGVNVFPNPADDHVDLDLTNYAGKDVTIYVYDQLGYQRSINRVNNVGAAPYRINLENANAGSYLVRIVAAGKRDVVKQVTVQK